MQTRTRQALLALSVPTDVIDKIAAHGHTIENLRSFSGAQLRKHYTEDEARMLAEKTTRKLIDDDVVERILELSGTVCAYCADGNSARPYEIHHIAPYAATQDNSEDNLILICPTHHASIHAKRPHADAQKRARREWYALAALGREYAARGIPFPFDVFEPVDFGGTADVVEVVSGVQLSPKTALHLSEHALGERAARRLVDEKFLLLVGKSGSGKSTLALGAAGRHVSSRVFQYRRPPDADRRGALVEVLTFIGTASVPTILVLDDANAWASSADLQKIATACSATVNVIATWTAAYLEGDPTPELHVLTKRVVVEWAHLRDPLIRSMLADERRITESLRAIRKDHMTELGFGVIDRSLESLLRRYADNAKSVWQFVFLLRGASTSTDDELVRLIAEDRADAPVLYAAIEQIAGVERPVSANETAEAVSKLSSAAGALHGVDEAWVRRIFEQLEARRVMVRVRNSYTTIHRDWALALISSALMHPKSAETAQQLLLADFRCDTPMARRLMVLWSWLQHDPAGGQFTQEWAAERKPDEWARLVGSAATQGLVELGMVADRLHLLFRWPGWARVVGDAFEAHEGTIKAAVSNAGSGDWYWLSKLFMALSHARPELARGILAAWEPEEAALAFGDTHPDDYYPLWWFLGGISKHSRDWCNSVGQHVHWSAVLTSVRKVRRGDIDAFEKLVDNLTRLQVPLLRSHVRELATVIKECLRGASLNELRFEVTTQLFWLELFPDDARSCLDGVDATALARELSSASPREWNRLFGLSGFAARLGSTMPMKLVDALERDFVQHVTRYADASAHEFRGLLWQLVFGSADARARLARDLLPVASSVAKGNAHERPEIVRAFASVDRTVAAELAADVAEELPAMTRTFNQPLLKVPDELAKELAERERNGVDYDVLPLLGLGWESEDEDAQPTTVAETVEPKTD